VTRATFRLIPFDGLLKITSQTDFSRTPRVVGTAGHVDHGKSSLVRRLTGIDPDRLAEEKARAMTIDLGFAWLTLTDSTPLGLIDVPGHRDFIANMLAGIGGIDAALLVIAADEGVMPQTREHLAILDLLGIGSAIVALTKSDLVDDADWLGMVEQEVRDTLSPTHLANAPIIPVSSQTGEGIPQLLHALTSLLAALSPRPTYGSPRLPVDRVFSKSGFGTIVTGTLAGGTLHVGDEVELQPSGQHGRIRGLQSYEQPVVVAQPGTRVAVNVSGVDRQDAARGQVLTLPGHLTPTLLCDVAFTHLPYTGRPLKHNSPVKVFSGSAEANARVRLLSHEVLPPGESGWLQLRLETPLALTAGDRFILRYPSPAQTIGGGVVVDAHAAKRHRRMRNEVITALEIRRSGTPAQRLAQLAAGPEPLKRVHLAQVAAMSADNFDAALQSALSEGALVTVNEGYVSRDAWLDLNRRAEAKLAQFHSVQPLKGTMPRELLRSQLGIKQATLAHLLDTHPLIVAEGSGVRLATHNIQFSGDSLDRVTRLRETLDAAPYMPPSFTEAAALAGDDVVYALLELGELVRLGDELIFARTAYETMLQTALAMIDRDGALLANQFRDHFGTSRKYAIGLLEHLDAVGVTQRDGDTRVRGPTTA
jgi:selenocysteine-specific elongation factor